MCDKESLQRIFRRQRAYSLMHNCTRFRSLHHETYRSFLRYLITLAVFLFIVNNRNILTDGINEKKYLRRKYNGL